MDNKNEILNGLKLSAELNQASIDYLEKLMRIADAYGKDRDEIVKREIKALFISASGSEFNGYELKNAPKLEENDEV